MTSDARTVPSTVGGPTGGARRNGFGVAAVAVGAAGVLSGAALTLGQPLLFRAGGGTQGIAMVAWTGLVVHGLLGVIASALALVGLLLPGRRRGAAAAGIALGAVLLLQVVVGLLTPVLYTIR